MACGNDDFWIASTKYSNIKYKIPCRRCINCRVDRRKQWADRCNYEFKKLVSGTFLTLTYDDNHLFAECLVKGNDEKIRATLKYKHIKKFLDSLRYYVKKEEDSNILRNPDFKYLGVGEYGENGSIFDRCHWHLLLFGLDFYYNKKLYQDIWEMGFIYSLPILSGGINYVLKYLDKQIIGSEEVFEMYRRYRIEPPKQFQSKGLGSGLYYDNYENAKQNYGRIKSGIKEIMIPQYYKNKMGLYNSERHENEEKIKFLWEYNIKTENPNNYIYDINLYQEKQNKMNKKIQEINEKKLRNLYQKAINTGSPVFNEYNICS